MLRDLDTLLEQTGRLTDAVEDFLNAPMPSREQVTHSRLQMLYAAARDALQVVRCDQDPDRGCGECEACLIGAALAVEVVQTRDFLGRPA